MNLRISGRGWRASLVRPRWQRSRLRDRFFGGGEGFTDVASAGNGGVATASANGGAVSIGNINSGGNVCNAIGIGDTFVDGWRQLPEHDRPRRRGRRRDGDRRRLRRRLQPRLRQLAPARGANEI